MVEHCDSKGNETISSNAAWKTETGSENNLY